MIYRALAKEYRFTADDVNRLTMYQLRTYLSDDEQLKGKVTGSFADVQAYARRTRREREAFVSRMMRYHHGD